MGMLSTLSLLNARASKSILYNRKAMWGSDSTGLDLNASCLSRNQLASLRKAELPGRRKAIRSVSVEKLVYVLDT